MDMDEEGMRVLADLHGEGDPDNEVAREEFREIKENVLAEVSSSCISLASSSGGRDHDEERAAELILSLYDHQQRLIGDRSYKSMFTRYKFRVFIAMSAQAFAQLVSRDRSFGWAGKLQPLGFVSHRQASNEKFRLINLDYSHRTASTSSPTMRPSSLSRRAGLEGTRSS
jgi:hypothetical protein